MMLNTPSPDSTNNHPGFTNIPDSTGLPTENGFELNFAQLSNVSSSSPQLTALNTSPQNEDFNDIELFSSMRKDILGQTGLNVLSSPGESPLTSPPLLSPDNHTHHDFTDANTQMSVVERAADLHLDDHTLWNIVTSDDDGDTDVSRKALKAHRSSDAASSSKDENEEKEKGFEAELAASTVAQNPFIFNKFGSDVPGVFTFGAPCTSTVTCNVINSPISIAEPINPATVTTISQNCKNVVDEASPHITSSGNIITIEPDHRQNEPSLNLSFPSKSDIGEAKVLVQPEEQHRARYQTEGSRGAVKDKSGNGCPVFKLFGYRQPVTLQIFIGTDSGKVKPHGFYQACKVYGKNATQCTETEIEGTTVIEVLLDPKDDMTANIDCVGILKLRNADVEQRIGLARSKKKSTRARIVFRVNIPKPDGSYQTLQVASIPISCTQPAGIPEICKMSLSQSLPGGGDELFIIGKNFLKGSKVLFQEKSNDNVVWSEAAEIDQEYFHASHLIAKIPAYHNVQLSDPVTTEILVVCGSRSSEGTPFTYTPKLEPKPPVLLVNNEPPKLKCEQGTDPPAPQEEVTPMETEPVLKNNGVSPEALALNKKYEEESRRINGPASMIVEMPICINEPQNPSQDVEMQSLTAQQSCPVLENNSTTQSNVQESLHELQQLIDEHGPETQNTKPTEFTDNINLHETFEVQIKAPNLATGEQQSTFTAEHFTPPQSVDNRRFSNENGGGMFPESPQIVNKPCTSPFDNSNPTQNSIAAFSSQESQINHFTSHQQSNNAQNFHPSLPNDINSAASLDQNADNFQNLQTLNSVPLFDISNGVTDNQSQNQRETYPDQTEQLHSPPTKKTFSFNSDSVENNTGAGAEQNLTNGQMFSSNGTSFLTLSDDLSQVKQQSPFNASLPFSQPSTTLATNTAPQLPPDNITQDTNHEQMSTADHQQQQQLQPSDPIGTSNNNLHSIPSMKQPNFLSGSTFVAETRRNPETCVNQTDQDLVQFLDTINTSQVFPVSQPSLTVNCEESQLSSLSGKQTQPDIPVTASETQTSQIISNPQNNMADSVPDKQEEPSGSQNSLQDLHKTMQELVCLLKTHMPLKVESSVKDESVSVENLDIQKKQELLMKSLQEKAVMSLPFLAQQVKASPVEAPSNTVNTLQQPLNPPAVVEVAAPCTNVMSHSKPIQSADPHMKMEVTDSCQLQQIKPAAPPKNSPLVASQANTQPQQTSTQPQQFKVCTISGVPQTLQSGNNKVQYISEAMWGLLLDQAQNGSPDLCNLLQNKLPTQQQVTQQSEAKPQFVTSTSHPLKILRLNSQGNNNVLVANPHGQIVTNQQGQVVNNHPTSQKIQGQIASNHQGQVIMNAQPNQQCQIVTNQQTQLVTAKEQRQIVTSQQQEQIISNNLPNGQITVSHAQGQMIGAPTTQQPVTLIPACQTTGINSQSQQAVTLLPITRQQAPLKIIPGAKVVTLTNGGQPIIIKGQQQPVTVVTGSESKKTSSTSPGDNTRNNGLLAQLLTGPPSHNLNRHHQQAMGTDFWQPPSLFNQDGLSGVDVPVVFGHKPSKS